MEMLQENMVLIAGTGGLLFVLILVFIMIRKRRKNKGEKAEFMVAAKDSIEPLHESEEIAVDQEAEDSYEPERTAIVLEKISNGNRFFHIAFKAQEDGIRFTRMEPGSNKYGELHDVAAIKSRSYHSSKPISIYFDLNERGVKLKGYQFELNLGYQDSHGEQWNQRLILDRAGNSRSLKPRRA